MSNNFPSLESITALINILINSNIDASPLKHVCKLVNDLTKLMNESDFYDVEIKIGAEDDDVRIFKAHSNILKARSSYFNAALSKNWVNRSTEGIILFEKDNISPKVFEVLLIYIYNGIIDINILDPHEIVELLVACDELNFDEFLDDLQNYLIENEKEKQWIKQNLNYLYQISSNCQSFRLLQDYFENLFDREPELFLKSIDFRDIEKPMLISILKRNELELKETYIWNCVIQWGIRQIGNLEEKNIFAWKESDIKELKHVLEDIIPLIRFQDISYKDFIVNIMQYQILFPSVLWQDISNYYMVPDKQLVSNLLPSRNSLFINEKLTLAFASWIDKKNPPYTLLGDVKYKCKLLYHSSRDGLSSAIFHQKCNDVYKTLVVAKIRDSKQLVGGYNPLSWNGCNLFKETSESFIFNISDENDINTAHLSYVIDNCSVQAVWCNPSHLPVFGPGNNFWFHPHGTIRSAQTAYYSIGVVNNSVFDELEVFQVLDKC